MVQKRSNCWVSPNRKLEIEKLNDKQLEGILKVFPKMLPNFHLNGFLAYPLLLASIEGDNYLCKLIR